MKLKDRLEACKKNVLEEIPRMPHEKQREEIDQANKEIKLLSNLLPIEARKLLGDLAYKLYHYGLELDAIDEEGEDL